MAPAAFQDFGLLPSSSSSPQTGSLAFSLLQSSYAGASGLPLPLSSSLPSSLGFPSSPLLLHPTTMKPVCAHCSKQFPSRSALSMHSLVHSGEKPFCCSFRTCGKKFRQKGHLISHLRKHTGEKPFVCEEKVRSEEEEEGAEESSLPSASNNRRPRTRLCGRTFKDKSGLNSHRRKAHGVNTRDRKYEDRGSFGSEEGDEEDLDSSLKEEEEEDQQSASKDEKQGGKRKEEADSEGEESGSSRKRVKTEGKSDSDSKKSSQDAAFDALPPLPSSSVSSGSAASSTSSPKPSSFSSNNLPSSLPALPSLIA